MSITKSLCSCRLFKSVWCQHVVRFSSCPHGMKVTICGAAGATGQPLSLLLKQSQLIDQLSLYDLIQTSDFGLSLNQVDTKCKVTTFTGRDKLCEALKGSHVVVLMPRSPCDSEEHNSAVIADLAMHMCTYCPTAFALVATQPVEITLPIIANIQKLRGLYNPRTLLGCVELLRIRASGVLADYLMTCGDDAGVIRVSSEHVQLPCVGGASAQTMVPLVSSARYPGRKLDRAKIEDVTSKIMDCCDRECFSGAAHLAGAYTLARIVSNVIKGLQGDRNITQLAFVDHLGTACRDCQFMSTQVLLGPSGAERNFGLPEMTDFEICVLRSVIPRIQASHYKANQFVHSVWQGGCRTPRAPPPAPRSPPCPVPPCPVPPCWGGGHMYKEDYMSAVCRQLPTECK